MKLLRKLKIGTRLFTMFAFLVVVLLIIAFSGTTSRLSQISDMEQLKQNYIDHLEVLANVNVTTGNLFLSYRNYFLEYPDEEKMQVRLNDINKRTDSILTNLQEYHASLVSMNATQEELDSTAKAIDKINQEVVPFNAKLIGLMQSGAIDEVRSLIVSKELRDLRSTLQDDLITKVYNDCVENITSTLDEKIAEMKTENMFNILLVVIGLAVAVFVSIITVRSLVGPVKKLVLVSNEITNGQISINLPEAANDEIGELTKQFGNVAAVLNDLIGEMKEMAAHHNQGDTDARINETRFNGAYRDVAEGVNEMTGSYIRHMRDICTVLKEFGDGDFKAAYATLPGKKAVLNEVVEGLRENLTDVDNEISTLSRAAIDGRLAMRANPDKFHGGWKKLLTDLNAVMDAIIMPITEASDVLRAMATGDLGKTVKSEYKGDFAIIKDSLNSTQSAISSYISEISHVLSEVSRQQLNVSITRPYIGDFSLIKDSINMIVEMFNHTLADFSESAEQVAIGSRQISDVSANLSQGATTQLSTVEELNASMDQVSGQTLKNAENARKASALAMDVKTNAEKEAVMMQETLSAMKGINESSANISKIIRVIEDIAFQTNLLALNASVEAARAGEHGRGFSVVADEVRNLASKSQDAAQETTALIEDSTRKASEGARVAAETAKGLEAVVSKIAEISSYVSVIAESSNEQSVSIQQINQGISQVSQVTMANTSISQECAASAEELSSQAELFKNTVDKFRLS